MILLTGATGFTGSYILRYLVSQGRPVRAIYRPGSPFDLVEMVRDKVEWVEADLLDIPALEDAFSGITQVYHAAAMVSFRPSDNHRMMQVNVQGTANVVNLSLRHGVQKLLHVSSTSAIGKTSPNATLDERTTWERSRYNSPYAVSKFRAEREVWRGMAEGLNSVIINPSIILGGGFWDHGSGRMISRVAEGLKLYPLGGTSLVDVRDVARIAIRLMESDISGERFIVTESFWPYKDLLTQIANELGVKPPTIAAQPWMTQLYGRLEEGWARLTGGTPTVTRHIARGMQSRYRFDTSKLERALRPSLIPTKQTLKESAQAYRETEGKRPGALSIQSWPLGE